MNIMDRQSDAEIIRTARILAGIEEPNVPEEPTRFDRLFGELEPLDMALGQSLDADVRKIELDREMQPYGENGPWYHAPASAKAQGRQKVIDKQNEVSARALFDEESWLIANEPAVRAEVEKARAPIDPVALAVANGYDAMQASILVELRTGRRGPFLEKSLPSSRARVYVEKASTLEQVIDNQIIETLQADGIGPATTDPREVQASEALRRRIEAAREARVPKRATELLELIAEARKRCSRAKQLHKIRPLPPARPW